MIGQIAFKFDPTTVKKIVIGAILAMTGPAAVALLMYVGTLHINNPMLAAAVAWLVPTAINAVKEWMAGQPITL